MKSYFCNTSQRNLKCVTHWKHQYTINNKCNRNYVKCFFWFYLSEFGPAVDNCMDDGLQSDMLRCLSGVNQVWHYRLSGNSMTLYRYWGHQTRVNHGVSSTNNRVYRPLGGSDETLVSLNWFHSNDENHCMLLSLVLNICRLKSVK